MSQEREGMDQITSHLSKLEERSQNQKELLIDLQKKIDELILRFGEKIKEQDKKIDSLTTKLIAVTGGLASVLGPVATYIVKIVSGGS